MLGEQAIRSLERQLGKKKILADPVELLTYESDASFERGIPQAVVFPESTEDAVRLVQWASEQDVPLIARGAGTGLSGGAVAERGGIIVEFARMNRVLELDAQGRSAVVEPGVQNLTLDEAARPKGLYYPPDPSSQRASTMGGNVAENAGGAHCFKYGVTANYVTGLQVVLADGRTVRVGGRAFDYPEYDLGGLIVGSEGTLALIAEITVRLVRRPPGIKTMLAIFDSVAQCGAAVTAVIAAGLVPATLELMDRRFARAVEEYAHAGLPMDAGAVLIAEVDGYPESVEPQMEEVARILRGHGARGLRIASNAREREQIWIARKSAAGVFAHLAPAYYLVDITVPRSRLAETLEQCSSISERCGLEVQYVLHAGDGNLHPVLLIPHPNDPHEIEAVHRAAKEMVELGVWENGSLTGEHGVGIEKREYMPVMFNRDELSAQWDVKEVFDPHQRLNPGKIFPQPFPNESALEPDGALSGLLAPSSAEQAARELAALSKARRRVRIGAGAGPSLCLSTAALSGIRTYAPDDLYVTVGAGTRLSDLQSELERDHNQVPLASPWPLATVGGIVAANVNAPLRMRYGSVRDLVLAMTVVLGDGRTIRAGRPVVKNVAGYDLTKVLVGSYGTVGLIAEVTLKLTPQPRARKTLLLRVDDWEMCLAGAERVLPGALAASAIVLLHDERESVLAYTAEGIAEDVRAELDEVGLLLHAAGLPPLAETESLTGTALWASLLGQAKEDALVVRIGVPPRHVAAYLRSNSAALTRGRFLADLAHGLVYAVQTFDDAEVARLWLDRLRQSSRARSGYAIVLHAPAANLPLDLWGYSPETLDLMRALKARWDPAGILTSELFPFFESGFAGLQAEPI